MTLPVTIKKHPSETINVAIDFTNRLAVGETISSAVAAVVPNPPLPPTITVGATSLSGTAVVIVPVLAGTDGQTDSFSVDASTNGAEVLAAVVKIAVSATDF
jgi:hypothetical protein